MIPPVIRSVIPSAPRPFRSPFADSSMLPRALAAAPAPALTSALASALAASLLLVGCGEDPLGADNRMALLALGKCRHDQALQLTANAMQRGNAHNVQQSLMLQAAILRDRGDSNTEQALYPKIAEAWDAVKRSPLTPERRERDIRIFLDVARDERLANGMDPDCAPARPRQPAAE